MLILLFYVKKKSNLISNKRSKWIFDNNQIWIEIVYLLGLANCKITKVANCQFSKNITRPTKANLFFNWSAFSLYPQFKTWCTKVSNFECSQSDHPIRVEKNAISMDSKELNRSLAFSYFLTNKNNCFRHFVFELISDQ